MNADVEIVIGRRNDVLTLPNGAVKTPREARELVQALGLDPELLQARAPTAPGTELASNGQNRNGEEDSLATVMRRLQGMSQEERREYVQSLDPADRNRLFQEFRRRREAESAPSDPGQPRPAFVFKSTPQGGLTIEPVTIGLSSWERTEVLAGVEEGEEVLQVPLALVQQRELLQRIRERSGVPGVSR